MKKEQSYTNDKVIFVIDKWFENRNVLSEADYSMIKRIVHVVSSMKGGK